MIYVLMIMNLKTPAVIRPPEKNVKLEQNIYFCRYNRFNKCG